MQEGRRSLLMFFDVFLWFLALPGRTCAIIQLCICFKVLIGTSYDDDLALT